jgi:AcrR family transcriptional regulator
MGIAERKQRQKDQTRADLINAAWKIVNEEGWQALSIRKIADAIEYSVPVIYEYFENKEALLFEFIKRGFKLLADELKAAKEHHRKPALQLEALAYGYWDFAFDNKEYYQLMFSLGMPGCDLVSKMPELLEFTNIILSTIEDLVRENEAAQINAFLKMHSFWSMLHGLVSINLTTPDGTYGGVSRQEMNKMILKDFIKSFIGGMSN